MRKYKKGLTMMGMAAAVLSLAACGSSGSGGSAMSGTTAVGSNQNSDNGAQSAAELAQSEDLRIDFRTCAEIGVRGFDDVKADNARKSTANSDERIPLVKIPIASYDLSPLQPYDDDKELFVWEVYESLMYRTANGEYEGRLAKSWEWEDDVHLLVELYDYIHDSAGNSITADDVKFSYDMAVNSGYTTGFSSYYYDGCEVVDDYKIRFNFTQKQDSLIAFNEIFGRQVVIVDEEEYGKRNFAVDPVGTGPYVVKEFVSDSKIIMEANDDYWQTDELRSRYAQANVQTLEYDVMVEEFQQSNAFLSGETMVIYEIEKEELPDFLAGGKNADTCYAMVNPNGNVHCILPNCSSESMCGNEDFRLAMWYAIDNDGFASGLGMTYTPATVISNPTLEDWKDEWYNWDGCLAEYDLDKAKEHLEKSGYSGEEIVLTCDSSFEKQAQILMGLVAQIGVNVKLNIVDSALLNEEISDPAKWDIYIYKSRNAKPNVNKLQESLDINFGKVKGKAQSFVEDSELQMLLENGANIDTYSEENTDAVMRYIIDHGYIYCAYYPISVKPYSNRIADFCFRYGTNKVVWGANNYYLD